MIRIAGRRLVIPVCDRIIAFEGDNAAKKLSFAVPNTLLASLNAAYETADAFSAVLKTKHTDDADSVSHVLLRDSESDAEDFSVWYWDIRRSSTTRAGTVEIQLYLSFDTGTDVVEWNSEPDAVCIGDSIAFTDYTESEAQLNEFKQLLASMGEKSTSAAQSAADAKTASDSAVTAAEDANYAARAAEESRSLAVEYAEVAKSEAERAAINADISESHSVRASDAASLSLQYSKDAQDASAAAEESANYVYKFEHETLPAAQSRFDSAAEQAHISEEAAKESAKAAESSALSAQEAAKAAEEQADFAHDNAQSSLIHMQEAARYASKLQWDYEHISDKDNPHDVTAEQTGAYDKERTDALLDGKSAKYHTHALAQAGVNTNLAGIEIQCSGYEGETEPTVTLSYRDETTIEEKYVFPNNQYYSDFSIFGAGDRVSLLFEGNCMITVNGKSISVDGTYTLPETLLTAPIDVMTEFGNVVNVTILYAEPKRDGFMSATDKETLQGVQASLGDIDTALDAILAIQDAVIGGETA